MKALLEAWQWYTETKLLLRTMRRIGERHWNAFPWASEEGLTELGKDASLNTLEGPRLVRGADHSLKHLDDMAIVLLFSVFEAVVRELVTKEVVEEARGIKHPVLVHAADEATEGLKRGNFSKVLRSLKGTGHDLVEQVRQIRQYRNWVSHGRRGAPPFSLEPKAAYDRLEAFLARLGDPYEGSE
jgi:hypothetical protein